MLAVIAAGSHLGIGVAPIRAAVEGFQGVRRRFEVKGEVDDIVVIDDYAVHPNEVYTTLTAAESRYPGRRIVCLFQPHTYSRPKLLIDRFATCFERADIVLVADIYAARERYEDWLFTAEDFTSSIRHANVAYVGSIANALSAAEEVLRPRDVFLTLGAGDAHVVGEAFLANRRMARSQEPQ
jgi:UDP-N-acetylmuramate--alanine ligase